MKQETNLIAELNKKYSYAEIAQRIQDATGRRYHPEHIGNVRRGFRALSDSLIYNLLRAFPECENFFDSTRD